MPRYLLESYVADSVTAYAETRERALRAASFGGDVHYIRTTFLPADETALHLFEAPSMDALRQAGKRAALHYERIVEAVEGSAERQVEGS